MVGMSLGLGLGLGSSNPPAQPISPNGGPELLLQAEIVFRGDKANEGFLVRAVSLPWLEIVDHLQRDPNFLFSFAKHPRKLEEFIAACYDRAGFDQVILTPQRGDGGTDVIAIKNGYGSIRFLDQVKAYSSGHRVTHNDVRAMLGSLTANPNSSKCIITTTSDFEPGIIKPGSDLAQFIPYRLELKNGPAILDWIESIKKGESG